MKSVKRQLALLLLVLLTSVALAETGITVSGEGEAIGEPDIAILELGVTILDSDIDQATQQAGETIASIMVAQEDAGIDPGD